MQITGGLVCTESGIRHSPVVQTGYWQRQQLEELVIANGCTAWSNHDDRKMTVLQSARADCDQLLHVHVRHKYPQHAELRWMSHHKHGLQWTTRSVQLQVCARVRSVTSIRHSKDEAISGHANILNLWCKSTLNSIHSKKQAGSTN